MAKRVRTMLVGCRMGQGAVQPKIQSKPKKVMPSAPVRDPAGEGAVTLRDDKSKVGLDQMISVIDLATNGFRHNEVIVQARLQNFLVADTILLASWAALFQGNPDSARVLVLIVVALLSITFSFCWTVLGLRHCQFLDLQMDIVCCLEEFLPDELRVTRLVKDLQDREKVPLRCTKRIEFMRNKPRDYVELSCLQKHLGSRNLLWLVPATFGVVSSMLLWVSVYLGLV